MDSHASHLSVACRHHWVIEMPNGPVSKGQCKRCGIERDFMNNPEDARLGAPQEAVAAA